MRNSCQDATAEKFLHSLTSFLGSTYSSYLPVLKELLRLQV